MDQKRLFIAIALSVLILVGFQALLPRPHHVLPPMPAPQTEAGSAPATAPSPPSETIGKTAQDNGNTPAASPAAAPHIAIDAPRLSGGISLIGARLDDVVLNNYHETIEKTSPLVQLLEAQGGPEPTYVQFGWTAEKGVRVPDTATRWTASADKLTPRQPVTLSWDNGAGLILPARLLGR